jgi:hypothetical protein
MTEKPRPAEIAGQIVNELRNNEAAFRRESANAISNLRSRLDQIGAGRIMAEAAGIQVDPTQLNPAQRQFLGEVIGAATDHAAVRVAQSAYQDPTGPMARLMEFENRQSGMRPVTAGAAWGVEQANTISGSGKNVVRYRVVGPNGELPDRFRHRTVAEMVAAALQQTGGKLPDQRIEKIRALCEEESKLISEISNSKRLIEGMDPGNQKRMGVQMNSLEESKRKLAQVRSRLGV